MSLTSADKAFGMIAKQKGFVSAEVLAAKEDELATKRAGGENVSLADFLVAQHLLDAKKRADVERIRARHGRTCDACRKETFLLPGDKDGEKACEFCGGKLRPKPRDGFVDSADGSPPPPAPAPHVLEKPPAPAPRVDSGRGPTSVGGRVVSNEQKRRQDSFMGGYEPPPPVPVAPANATGEVATGEVGPGASGALAPDGAAPQAPAKKVSFGPSDEEMAALRPHRTDAPPRPRVRVDVGPPSAAASDAKPASHDSGGAATGGSDPKQPGTAEAPLAAPGLLPTVPKLPLQAELVQILGAPLRGTGALFISLGSLLLGTAGFMTTHSLFPYSLFVAAGCALVFIYLNAYVLKTANASTAGSFDLPDWPDWEEAVGSSWPWDESGSLGFRLLLVQVACFWPYLFCVLSVIIPSARRGSGVQTVGEFAGQLAGRATERTGKSVADELLYDKKDNPWRIGDRKGRWLVMTLLEKETGDDTGMDKAIRSIPKMLPGMTYAPGSQGADLERLGLALPEVESVGVFIDPGLRYMRQYGLVPREPAPGRPRSGTPTTHPTPDPEDQLEGAEIGPDGQRKAPIDISKLPMIGQASKTPEPGSNRSAGGVEGVSLVVRTHEGTMPGALRNPTALVPTIWIVDPQGVVRREYEGGCSDKQLYATLKDYMAGGNGDVDPELLPLRAYGKEEMVGREWLATAFWLLGIFYYPIALLICTIFTSGFLAFRYPVGIVAIAKTWKDYSLLTGLFAVLFVGASLLSFGLSIVLRNHGAVVGGALATWVEAWLSLYASLVVAVGIGRLYVRHARDLEWLSVEETAPADVMAWRPDGEVGSRFVPPSRAPRTKTFGPPGFEAPASVGGDGDEIGDFGRGPLRPPRLDGRESPAPLKLLGALNAIPRWVEVVIAVLGIAVGCYAIKAEMRFWALDAVVGDQVGKLNRMSTVPVKAEVISELKKEGFDVATDEIQLMYLVKVKPDGELAAVPQAFVTVASPKTGYYHQCRNLTRTYGRGGFEVTDDPAKVWPAPSGRDKAREVMLFGGFIVGALFAAKAFLTSRD